MTTIKAAYQVKIVWLF